MQQKRNLEKILKTIIKWKKGKLDLVVNKSTWQSKLYLDNEILALNILITKEEIFQLTYIAKLTLISKPDKIQMIKRHSFSILKRNKVNNLE